MIHSTKKLFILFIIATICFTIIGCNENKELSSNEKLEKKISLYKNTNEKIKEDFKKNSMEVGPWNIIYCNDNKLIFNNYKYAIGYSTKKNMESIYSIIDLKNLDLHHVQGSMISMIDISPNGEKLTGINIEFGEKSVNDVPIFLIELIDEDISELTIETKETLVPLALNSQYYILKHDNLMIVDIATSKVQNVPYSGYKIENTLIQDDGDIFIQDSHSNIYLLSKKESYKETKTELVGTLLDTIGENLIWLNEGIIYKGSISNYKKIKDIGLEMNFMICKNGKAIFENDNKPLVYNLKTNTSSSFPQPLSVSQFYNLPNSVSQDMDKFFTNCCCDIQLFYCKDKEYGVNIKDYSKSHLKKNYYINSNCMWLDSENIIYIAQKENIHTLNGLMIVKYDIETGENTILFEF
ncbi:hypothetical protein [Oceanirhabdus sp. W0125-5]|uniref:hypothetical protein n=1 Tax=Oceanirhabdus sp. W0125-5 TaxID=2999116 RepID=UPI0022F2F447|nr:hypothetical protein [Oceanirhabdus sp. W0125-5]WBW96553.1 hypothetical protein OW730_23100 [Oceanirhabdus sp. W0125-5]